MTIATIAIGALLAVILIVRQVRPRPLNEGFPILPTVFGVLGVAAMAFGVASVVKAHPVPTTAWVLVTATFILAILFGWLRATTVRVWRRDDGVAMRRGTGWTTLLWLVSIAVHIGIGLGIDALDRGGLLGDATLYLYISLTLGAQLFALRARVGGQRSPA